MNNLTTDIVRTQEKELTKEKARIIMNVVDRGMLYMYVYIWKIVVVVEVVILT